MEQFVITYPDIGPQIYSVEALGVHIALHWYPLAYSLAFIWAWMWIRLFTITPRLWRNGTAPMTERQVDRGAVLIFAGVFIGARLGYVLFYDPLYFLQNPAQILMTWQGGLSFHGGLAGVALFGVIYARRNAIPIQSGLDSLAVTVPFGLFVGRIANFFNAELWGKPSTVPWAMEFPGYLASLCPTDWQGACTRHPSQLYEAVLEGAVLSVVLFYLVYKRRVLFHPGLCSGLFLAGYGLARFLLEFFREADAQFKSDTNPLGHVLRFGSEAESWGISMGQVLSIPMFFAGLIWVVVAFRRSHPS